MHMHTATPYTSWLRWTHGLRQELLLSWRFIARDVSSAVIPPLLFIIAAWRVQPVRFEEFLSAAVRGGVLFALYIYTFCLSNQIGGVEEDRLNKPDRPLAAGLTSVQDAQVRWVSSMLLYALMGWSFNVLEWVLMWQAVSTLHNFYGWSQHWFTKNLTMALGIIAQLACAWQLIGPVTPDAWRWILLISLVIFTLVSLQDLRDIAGDRLSGRRTLPLVMGELPARVVLALGFAVLPLVLDAWLLAPVDDQPIVQVYRLVLTLSSWLVAARVWLLRTPAADHRTYMFFTYIYCAILTGAIFVL